MVRSRVALGVLRGIVTEASRRMPGVQVAADLNPAGIQQRVWRVIRAARR
jgi:hypothetical protein